MTQVQRVLRMLHQRGGLGVTPVDFNGPDVIDGGAPILRLAGRINDLRNQGYVIRTFKQSNGIAKYVLVPQPGFVLSSPQKAPERVVGASGVAGADCSTESPAVTAPVSGRAPESSPEDYIEEEELLWV